MRAHWNTDDFMSMRMRPLEFVPEYARFIRQNIDRAFKGHQPKSGVLEASTPCNLPGDFGSTGGTAVAATWQFAPPRHRMDRSHGTDCRP